MKRVIQVSVGWMVALALIVAAAFGIRSCIRYEASKPKPPMIIVVEGVKYQDVMQSDKIMVNQRQYFKLHEQGEVK